jgi:hypothetical protein
MGAFYTSIGGKDQAAKSELMSQSVRNAVEPFSEQARTNRDDIKELLREVAELRVCCHSAHECRLDLECGPGHVCADGRCVPEPVAVEAAAPTEPPPPAPRKAPKADKLKMPSWHEMEQAVEQKQAPWRAE